MRRAGSQRWCGGARPDLKAKISATSSAWWRRNGHSHQSWCIGTPCASSTDTTVSARPNAKTSTRIDAYFVGGSKESAFVLAVQENSAHGLPLALPDRRTAAARILQAYPNWSDRRIAAATGLSARTVASVRCASAETPQSHTRLGKDGRVRPLEATDGRQFAAELIHLRPEASLREIAEATGISPSTVRDVRARLDRGESPVPVADPGKQKRSSPERDESALPHPSARNRRRHDRAHRSNRPPPLLF